MEALARRAKECAREHICDPRLRSLVDSGSTREIVVAFCYLAAHGMPQTLLPEHVLKNVRSITTRLKSMDISVDEYAILCYSELVLFTLS